MASPYTTSTTSGSICPTGTRGRIIKTFFVGNARTGGVREIFGIDLPWLLDAFGDVESVTVQKDTISDLGLP